MTSNAMFEGVFCPSITITKENGSVDYDNWGRHLDHLADSGIDGVLLFGSIGEFYSIDVHQGVVPEKLRTLDHGRPWSDDQFASTRLSSNRDMSR